jgi:hypothetical protein
VDGHYEINNPSKVACVAQAQTAPKAPAEPNVVQAPTPSAPSATAPAPVPPGQAPPPRQPETKGVTSSGWVGRYQDSRGAGEVSATLVRGTSMVSGTWTARTGGGGPLVGTLESDGHRLQFRMENLAPECPGTLQGIAELGDRTLVGTYTGRDCQGAVTEGRLDLHIR